MTQATDKDQLNKFKEAARTAEANIDERSFDEALGKIAQSKAVHASDCAVHNAPALKPGQCDCGAKAPR